MQNFVAKSDLKFKNQRQELYEGDDSELVCLYLKNILKSLWFSTIKNIVNPRRGVLQDGKVAKR